MKILLALVVLFCGVLSYIFLIAGMPVINEGISSANSSANISQYEGLLETVNAIPWFLLILVLGLVFYGFWKVCKR